MSIDADDDILQDFLVEAGEILEALGEQLVQLEQNPDDHELLNAVFRGFHTIKGGAGFLNLTNMVAICHRAEDVFNVLRQGQRQLDGDLMDAVLKVLDVLNVQFAQVRSGEDPEAADPALLETLRGMAQPGGAAAPKPAPTPAAAPPPPPPPPPPPAPSAPSAPPAEGEQGGDITDEEFEALLDAMTAETGGIQVEGGAVAAAGSDNISDEEFEHLLDELHGKGAPKAVPAVAPPVPEAQPAATDAELITDQEFEALLDELNSQRNAPASPATAGGAAGSPPSPAAVPAPQPAAVPAPQPEPKPEVRAATNDHDTKAEPKAAAAAQQADTTVRVDTKRLDDIMNLVGELVLVRNRLATLRSRMGDEQVAKAVSNLDIVTADLQTAVMKTRMQPIKKVFGRFPRVVRDLARSLKKEINLELRGEETDLDKNLVEALADPLVHLVRNAVDHGIETPEERELAGKPRAGTVVLAAEQEGDHILLTISDDGKGMDAEVLKRKAIEKGILDPETASRMSNNDAFNLIFLAGFSTKTEISDVSGRGVGMDVVKTRIAQLNGSVEIDSVLGKGSVLRIKVPLTLAILPTLMVIVGEQRFALPLANVSEIFDLDLTRTNRVDEQEVILVRNHALPLYYLRQWLSRGGSQLPKDIGHVVVVFIGNRRVGFVVDRLIGQEEVVIKPLGATLHGLPGFAGATITGDGGIALILDVPSLLKAYAQRF
jgi:two-component system chemotaxis sensor kinase CheA